MPRAGCISWRSRSLRLSFCHACCWDLSRGVLERHRATRLHVPFDEPYFQRLVRGFRGGPATVRVLPYAYTPTPSSIATLQAILARHMGGSAAVTVSPPVAYGDEDAAVGGRSARSCCSISRPRRSARCTAHSSRPWQRRECHPSSSSTRRHSVARVGGDTSRIDARRALWRDTLDAARCRPGVRRSRRTRPDRGRSGAGRSVPRRDGSDARKRDRPVPDLAHQCGQDDPRAHAARRRSVGEVRDAPHVTTDATAYSLIDTAERRYA